MTLMALRDAPLKALRRVFWGGHPNTFLHFFAWASLSFAYELVEQSTSFKSHGYELMRVIAPAQMWAAAFFIHGACIALIVARGHKVRVGIQLLVNCYGLFIWVVYIVLQDIAFGHAAINAATERVMIFYGFWALLRTGMNRWSDHECIP